MDTGLFVSGGMDGVVKVWDTNTLGVVLEFDFKDKVRMREKNTNAISGCYGVLPVTYYL